MKAMGMDSYMAMSKGAKGKKATMKKVAKKAAMKKMGKKK